MDDMMRWRWTLAGTTTTNVCWMIRKMSVSQPGAPARDHCAVDVTDADAARFGL